MRTCSVNRSAESLPPQGPVDRARCYAGPEGHRCNFGSTQAGVVVLRRRTVDGLIEGVRGLTQLVDEMSRLALAIADALSRTTLALFVLMGALKVVRKR